MNVTTDARPSLHLEAATVNDVTRAVLNAGPRGLVPRCPKPQPGDAGSNSGGTAVVLAGELSRWRNVNVDWESGTAVVPAGTTLAQLLPALLRLGWLPRLVPEHLGMTVGACIASDTDGRNAKGEVSFAETISSLELVTGEGERIDLTPDSPDSTRFHATVGGVGLTGVITRAIIDVMPVSSAWVVSDATKCQDFDAVVTTMKRHLTAPDPPRFLSALLDPARVDRGAGRGLVTASNLAPASLLPPARQTAALAFEADGPGSPLRSWRSALARRVPRAAFEAWYRSVPPHTNQQLAPMAQALFRSESITEGTRISAGRPRPISHRFSVPDSGADVIPTSLQRLARSNAVVLSATLRHCNGERRALLAAAVTGWILDLALLPGPDIGPELDRIDEAVAASGGRVQLAGDRRMRPELLAVMYPRLEEWRAVRTRMDPARRFQSDLARRLGL